MEIIPQNVYKTINGLPAYKSGEWPGQCPSFWKGSKLILKPILKSNRNAYNEIRGQKHFPPRYSTEYQYNTGKQLVKTKEHPNIVKSSKRILNPVFTEPKLYVKKLSHRPPDQLNSNVDNEKLFDKKKHFPESSKRSLCSREINVEKVMFRKRRVLSLDQQRNGFDSYFPGDKTYKCVENDVGFFTLEGLVVGSTHKKRKNKTNKLGDVIFFKTLDVNAKVMDRDKLWKSKVYKETLDNDKMYVESLNNWEETYMNKETTEPNVK